MQSSTASSSPAPDTTTLRTMQASDLVACHALTQALKWPHRLQDWQFVHALGAGFVIEQSGVEKHPTLGGSGLVWHYGATHASLGMVIVADALQGHGLGRQLMERLLAEAGARSVLLTATVAGRPLYEKLGFVATGKLHQHQGTPARTPPVTLPVAAKIRPFSHTDLPQVLALDRRASGMDRSAVINALGEIADAIVIEHDSVLSGFSFLRRFGRGHAIGPIAASDMPTAQAMISYWLNAHPDTFIRIDVPEQRGLSSWLSDIGLAHVDTGLSMCKGTRPAIDAQCQLYGLTNQALG